MAALCEADVRPHVVAVGGPTAAGKTALAVALAQRFDAEIVSADSMQVYRGLDIGTAKATQAERCGVPHHLLDILEPEQVFSVADFTAAADRCIRQIAARGRLPLVVGGTGLYIDSLLQGLRFAPQKPDPARRAALYRRAQQEGGEALYDELRALDPEGAATLHPGDTNRVLRALELYYDTGCPRGVRQALSRPDTPPYRALYLCLTFRERAELYRRTDARVDAMMDAGLLAEAEQVWRRKDSYHTAAQAIGYKEFFPYFAGQESLPACIARLKQATRRYAKRQLTWFRNKSDAVWLYADDPAQALAQACSAVQAFLAGPCAPADG